VVHDFDLLKIQLEYRIGFIQMRICIYRGTLGKLFIRTLRGGVCFRIIRCQVGCCRRVPSDDDPRFPDAMIRCGREID
jgi:hypothetical protein